MSKPSCTSITRIGGPIGSEVAIEIIQQNLLLHFQQHDETTTSNNQNQNNDSKQKMMSSSMSSRMPILQFSNKYFEARVQLKSTNDKSLHNCHSEKEDGIILVFPYNASIDSFQDIHNEIESNIHDLGDTLRLCLTTTTANSNNNNNNNKQHEKLYSERVLWCLDHGYEYIEVDLSPEGLTLGFDDREKDGFARVVEAMRGTVWSSALMKSSHNSTTTTTTGATTSTTTSTSNVVKHTVNNQQILTNQNNDKDVEVDKGNHSVDVSQKINEEEIINDHEINDDNYCNEEESKNNDNNDDKKKGALLDDIDKMMKEATRIRQDSKHGQLSDEERRKRAGDAANMLMGLLEQIGFDDDEEEDTDSSDDDCNDHR